MDATETGPGEKRGELDSLAVEPPTSELSAERPASELNAVRPAGELSADGIPKSRSELSAKVVIRYLIKARKSRLRNEVREADG